MSRPVLLRQGRVIDTFRSTEPITVEMEYQVDAPITGLRVGIYLMTMRGEYVFTSYDTDSPDLYDRFSIRKEGRYISRCVVPGDWLNEGHYVFGINASAYRVKRYFEDEHILAVSIDGTGAPGKQWHEIRVGPVGLSIDLLPPGGEDGPLPGTRLREEDRDRRHDGHAHRKKPRREDPVQVAEHVRQEPIGIKDRQLDVEDVGEDLHPFAAEPFLAAPAAVIGVVV